MVALRCIAKAVDAWPHLADPLLPVTSLQVSLFGGVDGARWQDSGAVLPARRLVACADQQGRPMTTVAARLTELEQELRGATALHACCSSGRAFSLLLSSCVVVSVRLDEDAVHICDANVDRRLVSLLAVTGADCSPGGAVACSAGFLTPKFAVLGYGDGHLALVRPSKPAVSVFSRFDISAHGSARDEIPDAGVDGNGWCAAPLSVAASIQIASQAVQVLVNADQDLVTARTATAVHFLSLSSTTGGWTGRDEWVLTPLRSVALSASERFLHMSWLPLKAHTLLLLSSEDVSEGARAGSLEAGASPLCLIAQTVCLTDVANTGRGHRRQVLVCSHAITLALSCVVCAPALTPPRPSNCTRVTLTYACVCVCVCVHVRDQRSKGNYSTRSAGTTPSSVAKERSGDLLVRGLDAPNANASSPANTSVSVSCGPSPYSTGSVGAAATGDVYVTPQKFDAKSWITSPIRERYPCSCFRLAAGCCASTWVRMS